MRVVRLPCSRVAHVQRSLTLWPRRFFLHFCAGTIFPWAVVEMPEVPDLLAPILYAIPAQLLAYHTAVAKGTDVDQPRNLAKSVTVE